MSLALTLLLSGCHSDNFFTPNGNGSHDGNGPAPDISVWPDDIDFGSARVVDDESIDRTISIANTGQADLEIFGTRVVESAGTGFVAGEPASILIPPGARTELPAWFRPRQYTLADGAIMIDSNDPDEPSVAVAVHGVGIAPAIRIHPDALDLGVVPYGCVAENSIDVQNVGNDTLVVDNLSFAATSPDIVADDLEPVTLEPGQKKIVTLTYTPETDSEMHGVLTATSNDPAQPTAMGTQVGKAGDQIPEEDLFEVPEQPMSDILFVIDNSNSMTPFQTELADNGQTFMDALTEKNSDWQVGVVTVDNPSLRRPGVITPDVLDPVSAFSNEVQAGTDAVTDEYQLYRAWETLQSPWGDFYFYLRDEASLAIILVSDERAQDPGVPRTTFMTDADIDFYVDFLYGLKDDDSKVAIHVVGSPPPLGCDPAKEPGVGLDYAVEATDGIFLSICDTDWGPGLASIAAASVPDLKVYHLSENPVVDTIEVTVNDDEIDADTLWFYDPTENAVVFHDVPEAESIVEIDYMVLGDCEQ